MRPLIKVSDNGRDVEMFHGYDFKKRLLLWYKSEMKWYATLHCIQQTTHSFPPLFKPSDCPVDIICFSEPTPESKTFSSEGFHLFHDLTKIDLYSRGVYYLGHSWTPWPQVCVDCAMVPEPSSQEPDPDQSLPSGLSWSSVSDPPASQRDTGGQEAGPDRE